VRIELVEHDDALRRTTPGRARGLGTRGSSSGPRDTHRDGLPHTYPVPRQPLPDLPDEASVLKALTFSWTDKQGHRWDTEPEFELKTPMTLRIKGPVRRDGQQVGVISRLVRRTPEGPEIQHIRIELDSAARGRGFATAYWEACLEHYADVGLVRITFTADEDGRRFWARDPVRFDKPEIPRFLLMHSGGVDALKEAGFGADEAERFAAEIETTPHLFTPASLNATPMGQALLTGAGAGWGAVVDIPPT